MSITLYKQSELWAMSPSKFNDWRRENDLPQLLNLFKEKLPGFTDWLKEFNIESVFCNPPHTGRWFTGNESKKYVEYTHANYARFEIIDTEEGKSNFTILNKQSVKITRQVKFTPYFLWGQKKYKTKNFICLDELNKIFSDSIKYNSHSSSAFDHNTGHAYNTRAMIFDGFSVLKLGECQINGSIVLDRNLDFVDLDGITFNGKGFIHNSLEISLSSCRDIAFNDVSFSSLCFYHCRIDQINIDSSRIRKTVFSHSQIVNIALDRSYLDFFLITHTKVSDISIKETNIVDHKYEELLTQNKANEYTQIKNIHRKFRIALQAQGKMAEAREHFYKEKKFERKEMYTKFDSKWFSSLLQDIIWGYGEKPFHAFISSIIFIAIFAAIYYWFGDCSLSGKMFQSLQYSIKAFLGGVFFENETAPLLKCLISIENILGVFLLGIFVAGYANKARY